MLCKLDAIGYGELLQTAWIGVSHGVWICGDSHDMMIRMTFCLDCMKVLAEKKKSPIKRQIMDVSSPAVVVVPRGPPTENSVVVDATPNRPTSPDTVMTLL